MTMLILPTTASAKFTLTMSLNLPVTTAHSVKIGWFYIKIKCLAKIAITSEIFSLHVCFVF